MSGLVGWTAIRPMCSVFSRPISFHVNPPSVDLYTPRPGSTELRVLASPVPTQTCIVSDGAIAMAPIDDTASCSNTGVYEMPSFVVFQTPPPAAPTKKVCDGPGIPTMDVTRPSKTAGPI